MSDFVRTFHVGPHRVTLTIPQHPDAMRVQWHPLPRRLSKKRIAEYVRKRDACLRVYAQHSGMSIVTITPAIDSVSTIQPELKS